MTRNVRIASSSATHRPAHDTPANVLTAAARDLGAPARLSVQSAFPSGDPRLFIIIMAALHPKPR